MSAQGNICNETFALKVEFPRKEERMCEYDRMWAEKRVKDARSPSHDSPKLVPALLNAASPKSHLCRWLHWRVIYQWHASTELDRLVGLLDKSCSSLLDHWMKGPKQSKIFHVVSRGQPQSLNATKDFRWKQRCEGVSLSSRKPFQVPWYAAFVGFYILNIIILKHFSFSVFHTIRLLTLLYHPPMVPPIGYWQYCSYINLCNLLSKDFLNLLYLPVWC